MWLSQPRGTILRFVRPIPAVLLAARLLALAAAGPALAQTWDGGGTNDNWSTAANWNPDGVPANNGTATLTFGGTTRLTPSANASWDVLGIVFNASAGAFKLGGSPLTIRGSGILNNSASAQTIDSDVVLATSTTQNWDGAGDLTVNGVVSGSGSLTKYGSGLLTLTGANTFTTILSVGVNGGPVRVKSASALGASGSLNYTSINMGGAVQFEGSFTTAEPFSMYGDGVGGTGALRNISGDSTVTGAITLFGTTTVGAVADSLTLSGVISQNGGNYGLTKVGGGTIVLSGPSTYQGPVAVSQGAVRVQHNTGLGSTNGGVTVAANAALQLQGTIAVGAEALTLNGGGVASDGALRNVSGNNSWGGAMTLGSAAAIASDSGTLTLSGNLANGGFLATVLGAGDVTLNGSGVVSGAGGLTKNGTGTLTLAGSNSNTFSGTLTVNAGTLVLGKTTGKNAFAGTLTVGDGSGGAGADVVRLSASDQMPGVAVAVNSSGLLDLNGNSDAIGALTMTGGGVTTGAGTLTLGGNLTGNADASTATIDGFLALGANRTFTVASGAASPDMRVSAVVSGAFTLNKAGAGVVVLSGANTYSGATTVSAGTLEVNNATGSGTGSAAVTVNAGATLGGTGTISGTVTVNGTVAPGASPGTLGTGGETWNGGGSYLWEVNRATSSKGADPGWDWLNITGALTIAATAGSPFTIKVTSLDLAGAAGQATSFNALTGYTWTIATASGGISGFAANKFTIDTSAFQNSTMGGTFSVTQSGNNLNLVYAPPLLSISGTVFEDVNYGGGAGRDRASASGVVRSGARVELFDGSGAYVTSTTTDGSGAYSFGSLAAGSYTVRVVDATVTSSRTGYVAGLLPVQTYLTDATTGTALGVTDRVGGQDPAVADAGAASAGALMNTATGVFTAGISGTAQSIAPVTFVIGNVAGLDFGFNFDTIVNTNDSGQGSLRQFINNANLLANAGLAQAGRTAGLDNAVWMISNGTSAAGLRAANNYFIGGVATIAPLSALPPVSDSAVLDAQTQPGWTASPVVEIDGASAGAGVSGLNLAAGGSTVRGLIVSRFTRSGILLSAGSGHTVAGNFIGTGPGGTVNRGNGVYGVEITGATGNLVGGSTATARNVIGWNTNHGVFVGSGGGGNNTISGNYLGVDATGAAAAPNNRGIWLDGTTGNLIGGSSTAQRNVIAGNTWSGIQLMAGASATIRANYIGINVAGTAALPNNLGINIGGSSGNTIGGTGAQEGNVISGNTNFAIQAACSGSNTIQGNTIGQNPARSAAIPNTAAGIAFYESSCPGATTGNAVGGAAAGAGNVISGNGGWGIFVAQGSGNTIQANTISGNSGHGVRILTGTGNAILANAISGNGGLGIELGSDGVTANDGAKTGGQPNLLMDFPVLSAALLSGTTLTVTGYVGSAAGQSTFAGARVEIFKSDSDVSGNGEGQAYLGFLTTDASGNLTGSITVSGLAVGDRITATATDAGNDTSEFGANLTVAAPVPTMTLVGNVAPSGTQPPGTDLAFTTTFTNVGTDAARGVVITRPVPANTDLKLGSVTQALGTTGLTVVITYSSDGGASWSYTPASGAGGAPAGYDHLATHVRWTFTGNLSQVAPNNSGSTTATVRIR